MYIVYGGQIQLKWADLAQVDGFIFFCGSSQGGRIQLFLADLQQFRRADLAQVGGYRSVGLKELLATLNVWKCESVNWFKTQDSMNHTFELKGS